MDVNSGMVPVKSRTALASMNDTLSQKRNKAMDAWLGICQRDKTVYKEMHSNNIIGPLPST